VRVVAAAALVLFAARTNRAWLVPCAMLLCAPTLGGSAVLSVLSAIPRLARPSPGVDVHESGPSPQALAP
jgi:hypothetical protein